MKSSFYAVTASFIHLISVALKKFSGMASWCNPSFSSPPDSVEQMFRSNNGHVIDQVDYIQIKLQEKKAGKTFAENLHAS